MSWHGFPYILPLDLHIPPHHFRGPTRNCRLVHSACASPSRRAPAPAPLTPKDTVPCFLSPLPNGWEQDPLGNHRHPQSTPAHMTQTWSCLSLYGGQTRNSPECALESTGDHHSVTAQKQHVKDSVPAFNKLMCKHTNKSKEQELRTKTQRDM